MRVRVAKGHRSVGIGRTDAVVPQVSARRCSGLAARAPASGIEAEHRLDARVCRLVADRIGRPGLDYPADVHHRDQVQQVPYDSRVAGAEQVSRSGLALQGAPTDLITWLLGDASSADAGSSSTSSSGRVASAGAMAMTARVLAVKAIQHRHLEHAGFWHTM